MFALIPILGPIIQGILTPAFNLAGQYLTSKVETEKVETQASVEIIKATEDDWGVRLARDILIWPWALWSGAIGWDSFIKNLAPNLMLHPVAIPEAISYMPYAVLVFLLGNVGLNMWKRNR